jgi:serine-type D-Ala-D-Ala carboxypeptidase (penicillin-binding protein 5/6)
MLESLFALLGFTTEPAINPPLEILEIHGAPILAEFSQPVVKAESAIIIDLESGKILFEKNSQDRLAIASLTKMMTGVVVMENYQLEDLVVVSKDAAKQPPAKIWLSAGEKITVENLLKAALIESANDAAVALADKIGIEKFVEKMNSKASALGLTQTKFANPVGYDDENNFSTTFDLAILAQYFLQNEFLKTTVATPKTGVVSKNGILYNLYSTNNLFGSYLDIQGLKTGRTEEAGECLAAISRAENGKEILAIVLDSPKRFQEVKALLTWAEKSHHW